MQTYHTKNVLVLFEPESNHGTVEKYPVAALPLPPLHNSLHRCIDNPCSQKTSIKNLSSKDPSGKQSLSSAVDFQTHVPKPSFATLSIITLLLTANKIKNLFLTVNTGKKSLSWKRFEGKIALASTYELIDKSDMKSWPKRIIKNEQICAECSYHLIHHETKPWYTKWQVSMDWLWWRF